jgi:hypothetical protein
MFTNSESFKDLLDLLDEEQISKMFTNSESFKELLDLLDEEQIIRLLKRSDMQKKYHAMALLFVYAHKRSLPGATEAHA